MLDTESIVDFFLCIISEQLSTPVVSGLIETVDRVMEHMVTNLEPSPNSLISLGGTSFVAGQYGVISPQGDSMFVVCVWTRLG